MRKFPERLATLHLVSAGTPFGEIGEFPRVKRPRRLPVVLSPGEVRRLLAAMSGVCALMAELLNGAGLRRASLRVRDLDFGNNCITVHEG